MKPPKSKLRPWLKLFLLGPCFFFLSCQTTPKFQSEDSRIHDWNQLVDAYFEAYYRFNPTMGTSAGFHQYDSKLEDVSPTSRKTRLRELKSFESSFVDFNLMGLPLDLAVDRDIVVDAIRAEALDLKEVKSWEKNPDRYSSFASETVFSLMSRSFAPQRERLQNVIDRERLLPAFLLSAQTNLDTPPLLFTQVALEQIPGILHFFQTDVPSAFNEVTDVELLENFNKTNNAVMVALHVYEAFLRNQLLAKSTGDFRLGEDKFSRKLLYEEHVDLPLKKILEMGYTNLRANQAWFKKVAAQVNPSRTPLEIQQMLAQDHPAPADLLPAFRNTLGSLKGFIQTHHVLTIPESPLPIVMETPPFARALTSASMDTPGPYETKAQEAYFNVTLPEKGWSPAQTEEFMEGFNRGTIVSTATHEAFPGHYVQFLWVKNAPSKVRKLLGANSNAEGWAHYCEQMMLDQGYSQDPKLRLGQLQDALLRNARYIVGIEMHTGKMTLDQGVAFFEKEGYQTHENAVRETKRGASDPTYLYYTLGKLEILKLREDYRAKQGSQFRLETFHNAFLQQGYPAIAFVRRLLLGENSGPVL